MSTGLDLIYRSLRLLRVKQTGQTPSDESTADALSVLNSLLAEFYGSDINLPDYTVTLAGDLNSDAADFEALAYLLAVRLAPEYGVSMSPEFIGQGQQSDARLRLRYFQPGTVDFRELPGACDRSFDIEAG